ncbi:hypothetical protein BN946_scf184601.g19 [Trametes cinnabarina]|uniref:Cellobiose dehydrogenase cytochrome domain-containing protein n=1 Tax=Pycnoporus cinnabarinus TaxID=5643 RepID=A0A060S756_PYCCI|nr:hypothetical protein BN946_scf184601.g19 [Trametes cinnabarina]
MRLLCSPALTLGLALIAAPFLGAIAHSQSTTHNVTVDDAEGSPDGRYRVIYSPPDAWKAGSAKGCDGCLVSGIDASKHITATILFEGTGLWVYGLIPRTNSSATDTVFFGFALDNDLSTGWVNATASRDSRPNSTEPIDYNVVLFGVEGLNSSQAHNFTLVVGPNEDSRVSPDPTPLLSSIVLLDYFVVVYVALSYPSRRALPYALPVALAVRVQALQTSPD